MEAPIPNTVGSLPIDNIVNIAVQLGVDDRVHIDTVARGLDYYTGPVFETVLKGGCSGSISGGGRYDGLIGMFSNEGMSRPLERLWALSVFLC